MKESALTAITSLAQTDFVRAVTSAGASRKATVANTSKAVIEGYTGTFGGISQTPKAALDMLFGRWNNASYSAASSRTITLTDDPNALTLYLLIVKNFISASVLVFDAYLIGTAGEPLVWSVTPIVKNAGMAEVTGLTSSGRNLTITFSGISYSSLALLSLSAR